MPGALNLTHARITERNLAAVPAGTLIVVYCSGAHGNGADRAALRLARLGRPVKKMIGGISGWKDEGFELETERRQPGRRANPSAGILALTSRTMQINVTFPGGKRVDASFDGLTVPTDQPLSAGGDGSAAAPFELFLASLGTCAGYYVLAFCQARGLSTDGIEVVEHVTTDPGSKLPSAVDIDVRLPSGFPEKYRAGVQRAAEHCKVKKVLESPPEVAVHVSGVVPPRAVDEPRFSPEVGPG